MNLQDAGTMNLLLWLKTKFKKLNMESFPQGVVSEVFSKYPSEIQMKSFLQAILTFPRFVWVCD